jgi:cytoskeletal protein RodZ
MLTGQPLFNGSNPINARRQHVTQGPKFPVVWAANLPEGAIEIFSWGLAQQPEHRLKQAGELTTILKGLTDSPQLDPIHTSSLSMPPLPPPKEQRVSPKPQDVPKAEGKRSGLFLAGITALGVIIIGLALLATFALYGSNFGQPETTPNSANSETARPDEEELPAVLNPASPTSTFTPTQIPTSQPPTATPQLSLQPTFTAEAQATAPVEAPPVTENNPTATSLPATATAMATTEVERSVTATPVIQVIVEVTPSPTPTETLPAQPTSTSPAQPDEPIIPAGKGMLIYSNITDYDLVVDVVNPATNTMIDTATLPPGTQKQFILDPGHYVLQAHSAGGKLTPDPVDFDIYESGLERFNCC